MLGYSARTFELLRDAVTSVSAKSADLNQCCANSAAVLASDAETEEFLARQCATRIRRLCKVFFSEHEAARFKIGKDSRTSVEDRLRIFAGGNMEGRKGTQLSLRALAILRTKGIPFSYTYGGWGPDLNAMRRLARDLGVGQDVCFHEGYCGEDYVKRLAESDVYLLPSIRETAGITMMEAMMAGCFPVVLAGTGAGDIVARAGGAAIQAESADDAVGKIADQLEWCYRHRNEMRQQSAVAGANVRKLYSEENYRNSIFEIYAEAIKGHSRKS
jgi:glycosyltransferase involved in cell wall biosynthesis